METATSKDMQQDVVSVRLPIQLKNELAEAVESQGENVNRFLAKMIKSYLDGKLIYTPQYLRAMEYYWQSMKDDTSGLVMGREFPDDLTTEEYNFLYKAESLLLEYGTITDEDELFFPEQEEEGDEDEEDEEGEEEEMDEDEMREEIKAIDRDLKRIPNKDDREELMERQNRLLRKLSRL